MDTPARLSGAAQDAKEQASLIPLAKHSSAQVSSCGRIGHPCGTWKPHFCDNVSQHAWRRRTKAGRRSPVPVAVLCVGAETSRSSGSEARGRTTYRNREAQKRGGWGARASVRLHVDNVRPCGSPQQGGLGRDVRTLPLYVRPSVHFFFKLGTFVIKTKCAEGAKDCEHDLREKKPEIVVLETHR